MQTAPSFERVGDRALKHYVPDIRKAERELDRRQAIGLRDAVR
jgi:hypothetical protein